jgi:TolB-like protein/cytochrome c-type biogenesis protein CcmH/NrfG
VALEPQALARLERLLEEAQDFDPAQRRRWLEELGAESRDLLDPLTEALLGGGLARATDLPELGRLVPDLAFQGGQRVGPYELIRLIGKGGMAQVWLARRADGAYERDVALKLPVSALRREDLELRFARERDILAALEHPNIARFYDAGHGADGTAYLALEHVPGRSITAWCDARRLPLRARVELFLQVLDALGYCHDRGVLHRDIKPANILVTEAGQVRLVDFGVARLHERDAGASLTIEFGRAATPGYASPEQMSGAGPAVAGDIYSLGIVLHELLCGAGPAAMRARALHPGAPPGAAPAWPSREVSESAAECRATTPARLARRLHGDLDAIVARALRTDPAGRYPNAAEFSADLRRHLRGEPVRARPLGWLGRTGRFVRRQPSSVLAAAALLAGAGGIALQAGWPAAAPAGEKSIAVLPFVNMSADGAQEYFADGLSEELIDRLGHSPDLRVISRTSSFAFKGRREDARAIGAKLGVAHLLEGSVRKSGTELRITAQLVRASDGARLWSQTYERDPSDIFKVQEEIAGTVAGALQVALSAGGAAARPASIDPRAYSLILEGNFFANRSNREDSLRAIDCYRRAIELDPDSARAWAEMGGLYAYQAFLGWTTVAEAQVKARAALERALRIDPGLSLAHERLGFISEVFDWDWGTAAARFKRALELDPQNVRAAESLAWLSGGIFGRLDGVIGIYRQGVKREPLDARATINLASAVYDAGGYAEAADTAQRALLLNPSLASAHAFRAFSLMYLGRADEALAAARGEADEVWRLCSLPIVYYALGRKAESDGQLRELERRYADRAAYNIADVYAYRGENDAAFRWLERAYRQHDAGMAYIRVDPLMSRLREDARFRGVLVRMRLEGDSPWAAG